MTGAAKEAQWGEHDESDASSTGFPALGNNFFEDDDEGSSDSGDEQAEEVAEASKNQKRIHDNYFSGYQRSLIEPLANNRDSLDQTEAEVDADDVFSRTVEPASDMLSPLVKVSRDYDQLSLNYQSRDLATGWKLGDFNVLSRIKHKGFTEKQCSTQGVSVVDDAHNSPGVLSKRGKS